MLNNILRMFSSDNKSKPTIEDGAKVYLDVEKIISGKNYSRMNSEYKEFVESSRGVVFTAQVEDEGLFVSMLENPKWLFWIDDVKKYKHV